MHMAKPQTIRITFRGLIVFHHNDKPEQFEAGILRAEGHVFSVHVSAFTRRMEKLTILENLNLPLREEWKFDIKGSVDKKVTEYNGACFSRDKHDFRWLTDLEDESFHGPDHGCAIDRDILGPVVIIPYGEVYTKRLTKRLTRRQGDKPPKPFGYAAQEIGFDINIYNEGSVALLAGKDELFSLDKNDDRTYEIVFDNSPERVQRPETENTGAESFSDYDDREDSPEYRDDDERENNSGHRDGSGYRDGSRHRAPSGSLVDHFHLFYNFLLVKEFEQYEFDVEDDEPGDERRRPHPNPAICPQTMVSASPLVRRVADPASWTDAAPADKPL